MIRKFSLGCLRDYSNQFQKLQYLFNFSLNFNVILFKTIKITCYKKDNNLPFSERLYLKLRLKIINSLF